MTREYGSYKESESKKFNPQILKFHGIILILFEVKISKKRRQITQNMDISTKPDSLRT